MHHTGLLTKLELVMSLQSSSKRCLLEASGVCCYFSCRMLWHTAVFLHFVNAFGGGLEGLSHIILVLAPVLAQLCWHNVRTAPETPSTCSPATTSHWPTQKTPI